VGRDENSIKHERKEDYMTTKPEETFFLNTDVAKELILWGKTSSLKTNDYIRQMTSEQRSYVILCGVYQQLSQLNNLLSDSSVLFAEVKEIRKLRCNKIRPVAFQRILSKVKNKNEGIPVKIKEYLYPIFCHQNMLNECQYINGEYPYLSYVLTVTRRSKYYKEFLKYFPKGRVILTIDNPEM
jgi:hypothetical protein